MAPFPIFPTIAIVVGLFLLEYIIYDSYKKNKYIRQDPSKNYSVHEQSELLARESTNNLMIPPNLPVQQKPNLINSNPPTVTQNHIGNTLRRNVEINSRQAIDDSPPLPQTGLPEGWTIEQWNYYGAQWLESRKMS
ncbi:MAG: hypothetical protein DWB99_03795 [Candidatus Poseidoniales archaeon]|nr:MAG: hypothetical protein DWB99_03795 [Candidatus Poseidoniales archaeon]